MRENRCVGCDELAQLAEENARLREALNEILSEAIVFNGVPEIEQIGKIAREAIEG